MFDLITTAYAESGTSTTAGGGMSSILMIVVMIAIFYFLLIRQNQTIGKEDRNYCWPPSRVVPRLRLNFSIYSPENFGCFPENNG